MPYQGSCLCEAATYATPADAASTGNSYCRDCQKESGTGHITGVAVPHATPALTGAMQTYRKPANSGGSIENHFCSVCGTTLFHMPSNLPGLALLRAGTLDTGTQVRPQMNLYVASAPAWDPPAAELPRFPGMPPR